MDDMFEDIHACIRMKDLVESHPMDNVTAEDDDAAEKKRENARIVARAKEQ